jgi:hypothetical protein
MRLSLTVLREHAPICAAALLSGLYGWALLAATLTGHDGAIGLGFNALGADWIIAQEAARAVLAHQGAHIYDQSWITHMVNRDYAHWLSRPLPYPVFPYPPVWLLIVTPFALLPMPLSVLAFQFLSFIALAFALRKFADDRITWSFLLIGVVASASAAINMAAGQNAYLVGALLVGGFALLDATPLAAGIVLGLLVFKPQFLPLAIVALVAMKSFRALAAMVATIVAAILLSIFLFGADLWWDWANSFLHPGLGTGVNGSVWGHMWDNTVSTCLSLLGAPPWAATAGQAAAFLISLVLVWRAFRSPIRMTAKLGVLLCTTLLASPHMSSYDMVLLTIAALIAVAELRLGAGPLAFFLPLAAYAAPIYDPPRYNSLGLVTPLFLLGLAGWFFLQALSHGAQTTPLAGSGLEPSRP